MNARLCDWCHRPIPPRARRELGAEPGDDLDDLYPGSGGIGRAWRIFAGADVLADRAG